MQQQITLSKPDDAHIHLRDGAYLTTTVSDAAKQFERAVVMPNLKPPVTTVAQALAYRERILAQIPAGYTFQPLMTLYLTDSMTAETIAEAKASGVIIGVKLYPAGVTTHSEAGVNNLEQVFPALEAMSQHDLPLLIHGEVNDAEVDIFDRERYFLEQLARLIERLPTLRIVLEHITTEDAVQFISKGNAKLAATITAHHLLLNRNDLLAGGIRPHHYCLPVLKRKRHQLALIAAATSGDPKFFLGTDSAPHTIATKENSCGCAGVYSAHAALELYAEVFAARGALDKLEGFASHHAADFYGLPRNVNTVTLIKKPWQVPETLPFGEDQLVPLRAGQEIGWQLV